MNLPNEGASSESDDHTGGEGRAPRKIGELHKTITMAQIAKAAGVSQGAISSLLNDRDYGIRVSEKTRERVFRVCREMGYIPNDLRAVVRMYPELGEFCLLISSKREGGLADPLIARIAGAAMDTSGDHRRSLTVGCYDEEADYSGDPELLPHAVRTGVASKFVLFGAPNVSLIQVLVRRGWPLVSLGYDVPLPGVLSLVPDYQLASKLGVEHLLHLGHRNIGIVSGPFGATEPQTIELNRGVRLAFEQFDLTMVAQNVIYGDLSFQAGIDAFTALKERKSPPTAVFCMSDAAAAGVVAEAHARGCKVPEDLSVVGCGDGAPTHFTSPALTTVHIPAEELAEHAVREVDRLVREGVSEQAKKEIFGVRLVERQSCAPASGL